MERAQKINQFDNSKVGDRVAEDEFLANYQIKRQKIINNPKLTENEKATKLYNNFRRHAKKLTNEFRDSFHYELRHEDLPDILGANRYLQYGREIAMAVGDNGIAVSDIFEQTPELSQLSNEIRQEIIGRYVDKKILKIKKDDTIHFGKDKNAEQSLRTGSLDTARHVGKILLASDTSIDTLDDVRQMYQQHDSARKIKQIEIETNQPSARILAINELRIGHQDSLAGIDLVENYLQRITDMDETEKPSIILLSNLVQGDFSHSQSKKRASLVRGLDSMNNQFKAAQMLIDKLAATDIPIVHTLGADDHRIAHDYTLDIIGDLRALTRREDNHINYYNANKLLQSKPFQQHKLFQLEYALPLCYRLGRRLRTDDEMREQTDGLINRSEYLMIYDHIVQGEPLDPALGIDPEMIRGFGEWYHNTVVVDDVDLFLNTEAKNRRIEYRHVEALSPESLAANHNAVLMKQLGNLATNGFELPDAIMTGRAQEATYVTSAGVPIVSLPGLTDPASSLGTSQYYRQVTGDASLRAHATRKRFWTPTINEFELADNGDIVHRYINKDLLDKADSLPRTAVFELCDIQKGSPTARTDYFVKYLSYILETAERMPVALQWAGDIIHGHIYPNFSDESQAVGLIKIASQKQAVKDTLLRSWGDASIPSALLDAVIDVLVQQGNHDEIQKKRVPGNNDSNIDYLVTTMESIFDRPNEESKVRHNAIFHTPSGTPVPTWMGTTHLGAYTLKTAHYHIERGMKGDTGGLPLYHPYQRSQGLGAEEDSDILLGAHWHNEQAGMVGNKLVVIGGAWAERSQFEDMRGYDAKMAGSVVFLGGGEPPEVRFIHPENLDNRPVKYGYFRADSLADHGFYDDKYFDPTKHAQYSRDDMPKSAVQKALNKIERDASQLTMFETEIRNPNTYNKDGSPKNLNLATRRAFAQYALRLSQ